MYPNKSLQFSEYVIILNIFCCSSMITYKNYRSLLISFFYHDRLRLNF